MEWPGDAGDVRLRVLHSRRFPFEGVGAAGRKGRFPALKGTCTGNRLAFVRFLLRHIYIYIYLDPQKGTFFAHYVIFAHFAN